MSKLTILIFCVLGLISACVGQSPVIDPRPCPEIFASLEPLQPGFNIASLLGIWYDIGRYPQQTQSGQCNRAEYRLNNNPTTPNVIEISVVNRQVVDGKWTFIQGTATPTGVPGELKVIFPSGAESTLRALTVTNDYAVLFSCSPAPTGTGSLLGSWKMSRTPSLAPEYVKEIDDFIANHPILESDKYSPTSQECTGPIEMVGSCESVNIQGLSNINWLDYLGEWREVARYPQTAQTGQCNRAQYTAGLLSGLISVTNSQVTDGKLSTISGQAVINDNGKMTVTINDNTVDYYVLATNYEEYALVYTCQNIEGGNRRVGSWQLSRTGSLTPDAQTAMNTIIHSSDVVDLFEGFYQPTKQDPDSCYNYPDFDKTWEYVELPGKCDDRIKGVENFDLNRYTGEWIEVSRYPQPTQTGQCNRAKYEAINGGGISVTNRQVVNQRLATISGQAVASADGFGKLEVTFSDNSKSDYYVLATDYQNYALVYTCNSLPNGNRRVGSWVLSKTGSVGLEGQAEIDKVVSSTQGLHPTYYQKTGQGPNDCFYYPEFDPTWQYVELDGSCDPNIKGIAGFDANSYQGEWIELARYPQPTQTGQCNRAKYEVLTSNTVSVLNSQVINEEQFTISGQAVASDDGTGQLKVTFNNVNGESNYYVLAVKYDEYALVYSCSNLDNGKRRVGSWVLSRSGTLSEEANNKIDEVISQTQGLLKEYYLPTSQSYASCFYYPEVTETQQYIELPGPCDTSIRGISDFKPTAYEGLWIEVARYPQGTQAGQCNRANYSIIAGGAVSVMNSQVTNGESSTIQGTAIATRADGTAELEVTFSVNGEIRRSNYYVLATDYISYALVYSCTNVNNEGKITRRVGSWKLSRSGKLSTQDNAAIDAVVSTTQGLKEMYYQATDQSTETCFYYPNIALNDDIIIPGQCDQTISGVPSFDVDKFEGNWYQIRRYDPVTTTCVGMRFTSESDSIKIISYEVVNGELSITEGTGRINSTDSSGQIAVTLPVADSEESADTIVYILATDYTNYALAYSCSNVNAFERKVRAWQLSRERTMSSEGGAAIAAQIQARQELHEPYFRNIEHDENCPEPSSAFLVKSSIVVLLVCAIFQLLL
nr:apolipoprotein [Spodoptera frugiperda]